MHHIVINNFYYKTENKDFAHYLDCYFRRSKISLRLYNNSHHTGSIFRGVIAGVDDNMYNEVQITNNTDPHEQRSLDSIWESQATNIECESDMITLLCDIVTKFKGSIDL